MGGVSGAKAEPGFSPWGDVPPSSREGAIFIEGITFLGARLPRITN